MLIKVVLLIAVVLLFRWCSPVLILRGIVIVPPVFRCFASVPVFCKCSGISSVFRCSTSVLLFRRCSVFKKLLLRNFNLIKKRIFQHQYQRRAKMYIYLCLFFDWFPLEFVFICSISLM